MQPSLNFGTKTALGGAPTTPSLVRPSCLPQISMLAVLAPVQQTWVQASLPAGPSLHQGRCLTRMSPLDSCRQCRASSWLVPAPGKILEQAAVNRSSTGASVGRREKKSLSGPSPPTCPTAHLHLLAPVPSHLASASPGCSRGPPTAAIPSRPCGGLQLPERGPSSRGSPLGTGSPH